MAQMQDDGPPPVARIRTRPVLSRYKLANPDVKVGSGASYFRIETPERLFLRGMLCA
jgi:hypothetical protein